MYHIYFFDDEAPYLTASDRVALKAMDMGLDVWFLVQVNPNETYDATCLTGDGVTHYVREIPITRRFIEGWGKQLFRSWV